MTKRINQNNGGNDLNRKKLMMFVGIIALGLTMNTKVNAAGLDVSNGTHTYDVMCDSNQADPSSCYLFNRYKKMFLNSKISSFVSNYIETYEGQYVGKNGELGTKVSWSTPYQGQCASLVKYYLLQYGYNYDDASYGDAKDYVHLKDSTIVTTPQDGDLVIWTSGSFGHIGIYYQGKVFNQNPKAATLDDISDYDSLGQAIFVRPNYQMY